MSNWPTWDESRRRREKAIELRKQGYSYREILDQLGGTIASMSLWLRDIPVPPVHRERVQRRQLLARRKRAATLRRRRLDKEARIRDDAPSELGAISARDLFIAGVAIYAAEGTKQKRSRPGIITTFINSDPA